MTTVAPARQRLKVVCPHDCPDTCVKTVDVEGGRAVGLGGDPEHRFTQGFLCAKVNHYLERVYSPDRILHPMKRVGAKGEGRFERITWDEALDTIAARFREVIAAHGPQAILPPRDHRPERHAEQAGSDYRGLGRYDVPRRKWRLEELEAHLAPSRQVFALDALLVRAHDVADPHWGH